MFTAISNAHEGFFKTIFAIFFGTLSPLLPKFLKNSRRHAAKSVLSLTVVDFFQLPIEQ